MKQKPNTVPMCIEHEDVFYSTEKVMEEIHKTMIETKEPLTVEEIAEQTGFPVEVVKTGIKMLQKTRQLKILDAKKNPIEVLSALGSFPILKEQRKQ